MNSILLLTNETKQNYFIQVGQVTFIQGIVGCTPTNVLLWEIPILRGYLWLWETPKNPIRAHQLNTMARAIERLPANLKQQVSHGEKKNFQTLIYKNHACSWLFHRDSYNI